MYDSRIIIETSVIYYIIYSIICMYCVLLLTNKLVPKYPQQQQKSPPNRNSIKNNSKMVAAGSNASTSWSKYKRGSSVGTVATSISNTGSVTSPTVIVIEEFDADVFRQLVEYVHTGCVTLQPRTLLGKSI